MLPGDGARVRLEPRKFTVTHFPFFLLPTVTQCHPLSQMWARASGGSGRRQGVRKKGRSPPVLCVNALCSVRQTLPRVLFWEAALGQLRSLLGGLIFGPCWGLGEEDSQWSSALFPVPSELQPKSLTSFLQPFPPNEREKGKELEDVNGRRHWGEKCGIE